MIKNYLIIARILLGFQAFGQTTLTTGFTNNNGSGTVTFNLQNTNAYDIIITSVSGVTGSSGTLTCEVYYKTTPLNGSPGAISAGNGWVLAASGTFTGVPNTSSNTTQPFLTNTNITIPANTTYAMAVFATSQRYSTISSGTTTVSAGGVNLITGTSIGYGGGTPPATPGNSPRGWIGQLTFIPGCFSPTNVAASNITTTSADISWSPVTGSMGYEYIVDQNSGSPSGAGGSTTSTTHSITGLSLNTTYYIHVRNKCNASYSNWINQPFITADAYCKPPTNILFYNITSSSAGVLWSLMQTADHYEYYIDLASTPPMYGTPGVQTTTGITTNLNGLQPDTKYYFFVRSFCLGGNDSSTWRVDSFVTKSACYAPEPVAPDFGKIQQTVLWNMIPSAVAYEYVVNDLEQDPAFGTQINDTVVSVTLPGGNSTQYLHVRSKCNSQFTFSDWNKIMLREAPQGIVNINEGADVSIYPNPAHDMIFVKNAQNKTYHIIDMRGSELATGVLNGEDVSVSLGDMVPGVYILQVDMEGGRFIQRFTKQ